MPLSMSPAGVQVSITQIRERDEARAFLEKLGFVVGGRVTVISELDGSIIVNVKDSRVAINKAMANRIIITGA